MIDNYIKFIHQVLDENIPAKYRLEKDIIKGNLSAIDTKFNQLYNGEIGKKLPHDEEIDVEEQRPNTDTSWDTHKSE